MTLYVVRIPFGSFAGMVYLHQRDIIHRDLKSSNGKKVAFELIIMNLDGDIYGLFT